MRPYLHICSLFMTIFMFLPVSPAYPEEQSSGSKSSIAKAQPEITTELDAYYTNIGIHLPLTDNPIPDIGETEEIRVYKQLFLNSLMPRFILFEASVFPMPVLGTYLKSNHRSFYDSAGIDSNLNLFDSITAGFQEPAAFSVFFGDIVTFVKEGEPRDGSNKGYMGYLFTFATQHIRNNRLIEDDSLEIEWKLKGEKKFRDEKLSWSFRLGSKIHDNPDIADVAYLGLRRSSLDFNSPILAWLTNSSFEFKWDFAFKGGELMRQEYIIGKKYPLKDFLMALKLDFGLIWQNHRNYTGKLSDRDQNGYTIVLRPNLQF